MQYVRYVGLSHARIITADDWRRAGINNGETVAWNPFNGFAVPLDQFTDEQIRKAIKPDSSFVITGEGDNDEEEFVPTPVHDERVTPAQLDQRNESPADVVGILEGRQTVSRDESGAAKVESVDDTDPATFEKSGGVTQETGPR